MKCIKMSMNNKNNKQIVEESGKELNWLTWIPKNKKSILKKVSGNELNWLTWKPENKKKRVSICIDCKKEFIKHTLINKKKPHYDSELAKLFNKCVNCLQKHL